MLGVYLFSVIVGVGLLLFSVLGSGDGVADAPELDTGGVGGMVGEMGELVLGLFRPRNLTFLLAAFGSTGLLLTWAGTNSALTLTLALVMGVGSWFLSHAVFTWLKRSDSALDVVSDVSLEGSIATVTIPVGPGARGRVTTLVGGRQAWMTARLEDGIERILPVGTEVLIRRTANGVAEVIPIDTLELPPSS
jgi:hypothetical protein